MESIALRGVFQRLRRNSASKFFSSKHFHNSLCDKHKEFLSLVSEQGSGSVTCKLMDKAAIISISNPQKRNAISGKMMVELARIVDDLQHIISTNAPTTLVGLVLKGCGNDAFSSGADFSLVKSIVNTPSRGVLMSNFMTDTLNTLRQCGLVSVCVINGPALGGGAELSTTCDFRVITKRNKSFVHYC